MSFCIDCEYLTVKRQLSFIISHNHINCFNVWKNANILRIERNKIECKRNYNFFDNQFDNHLYVDENSFEQMNSTMTQNVCFALYFHQPLIKWLVSRKNWKQFKSILSRAKYSKYLLNYSSQLRCAIEYQDLDYMNWLYDQQSLFINQDVDESIKLAEEEKYFAAALNCRNIHLVSWLLDKQYRFTQRNLYNIYPNSHVLKLISSLSKKFLKKPCPGTLYSDIIKMLHFSNPQIFSSLTPVSVRELTELMSYENDHESLLLLYSILGDNHLFSVNAVVLFHKVKSVKEAILFILVQQSIQSSDVVSIIFSYWPCI